MNENPFETNGGNEGNPFNSDKKSKRGFKVFLIILVIVLILLVIFAKPISKQIKKMKIEHTLNQIVDGTYDGDLSEFSSLVADDLITFESELLGEGENLTLTTGNATESELEESFIEDGINYKYDGVVTPGVYTVSLNQGDEVAAGKYSGIVNVGYSFGLEPHDDVINQLVNVTINEDDKFFVESNDDFNLELTPQTEYVEFDQNDTVPGIYTAGINIDEGTYTVSSNSDEAVNFVLSNEEGSNLLDTDSYDEITLEYGESIIIDNENFNIEVQE